MNDAKAVEIFRALGDGGRLRIVRLLTGGELCACQLLAKLDFSQPTLSHHMRILCACGLVECRKDGKWCHYSLNKQVLDALGAYWQDLLIPKADLAETKKECCRL